MPPVARRDDLLTVLVGRLDKIDADLTDLRELVAKHIATLVAGQGQSQSLANTALLRGDDHERRLTSLEETRSQARGAARVAKVLWAIAVAIAGLIEWMVHRK
jgi:hypothetical protein